MAFKLLFQSTDLGMFQRGIPGTGKGVYLEKSFRFAVGKNFLTGFATCRPLEVVKWGA